MYSYKLLSASATPYVFKGGDIVQVRRGGNTSNVIHFYDSPTGLTLCLYDMEGNSVYSTKTVSRCTSSSIRNIIWTILRGAALYLQVRLCPNGVVAIPEEGDVKVDEIGEFIIWNPKSKKPPRVVLTSRSEAKGVAVSMSERYNETFHWCKLLGKAEQVTSRKTKITE